jgi:hypothetical protein
MIFQTFNYDYRLGDGEQYLKADYSIKFSDPDHGGFRLYAFVMMLVYCGGIPMGSLLSLNRYKIKIQRLQLLKHSRIGLEALIGLDEDDLRDVRKQQTGKIKQNIKSEVKQLALEQAEAAAGAMFSGDGFQAPVDMVGEAAAGADFHQHQLDPSEVDPSSATSEVLGAASGVKAEIEALSKDALAPEGEGEGELEGEDEGEKGGENNDANDNLEERVLGGLSQVDKAVDLISGPIPDVIDAVLTRGPAFEK